MDDERWVGEEDSEADTECDVEEKVDDKEEDDAKEEADEEEEDDIEGWDTEEENDANGESFNDEFDNVVAPFTKLVADGAVVLVVELELVTYVCEFFSPDLPAGPRCNACA